MMNGNDPLFLFLKSPAKFNDIVKGIKIIKPIQTDNAVTKSNPLENVLSDGQEFIIINFSDYFPYRDLMNHCINFEIYPLSLTNILNVLYSIWYWLSKFSNFVFLYGSADSIECHLILTCYYLWRNTECISSVNYKDVLLSFIQCEKDDFTIQQIPNTVLSTLESFYSILSDTKSSINLTKILELRNCQIIGLFRSDHSPFSEVPVVIIGKENKILFSTFNHPNCVDWRPQSGELIVLSTTQIQGDFYISCYATKSDMGETPPLFHYCTHTGFIDENINHVSSAKMDVSEQLEGKALSMILVSSKEISNSIPIPTHFEFHLPSTCGLKGLKQLITHHADQLEPEKRVLVEKETEEERKGLLHLGLLYFRKDVERARAFVNQVCPRPKKHMPPPIDPALVSSSREVTVSSPREVTVLLPKEVTVSSFREATVSSPKEVTVSSPKEATVSSPRAVIASSPRAVIATSPRAVRASSPTSREVIATSPKLGVTFMKDRVTQGRKGVFLRYHPDYKDFFDWWLEDGLDKETVELSIQSEGLDPKVLERNQREIVAVDDIQFVFAIDDVTPLRNEVFSFVKRRNHPVYAKYYNKLALGRSKIDEIREMMLSDGVDPTVLELDQNEWIRIV